MQPVLVMGIFFVLKNNKNWKSLFFSYVSLWLAPYRRLLLSGTIVLDQSVAPTVDESLGTFVLIFNLIFFLTFCVRERFAY